MPLNSRERPPRCALPPAVKVTVPSLATQSMPCPRVPRWWASTRVCARQPDGVGVGYFAANEEVAGSIPAVPARPGMAGIDAIIASQPHGTTELGKAVEHINKKVPHDRLIVITDEQSQDVVPDPVAPLADMINVASYRNGVGYGRWVHIDGFSEQVLRFIAEYELGFGPHDAGRA